MVGPGWSLTACGFSGSASEDDPYAIISGGRLGRHHLWGASSSSSLSSPLLSSELDAMLHPHPHPLLMVHLVRLAAEEAPYLSQLAISTMAGSERRM